MYRLVEQQVGLRNTGWIIELWECRVERGLAGRQNEGPQLWSCSQSGQDLWAQGGHPSSAPTPTPTLAFQALIFHMISLPPVLRLALGLQAGCVTAPFSTGKVFTETCFITVDLMELGSQKLSSYKEIILIRYLSYASNFKTCYFNI